MINLGPLFGSGAGIMKLNVRARKLTRCLWPAVVLLVISVLYGIMAGHEGNGPFASETPAAALAQPGQASLSSDDKTPERALSVDETRMKRIEDTIRDIQVTGQKAESRTYFVKETGYQIINLIRIAVGILILIAAGVPLVIWIFTRRGLLDFSGHSSRMSDALVEVEERQAKLVSIFKDLQDEIEILNASSAPDLKRLVERASQYIEQNEKDLGRINPVGSDSGKEGGLKQ
jgi:hypothetical protein